MTGWGRGPGAACPVLGLVLVACLAQSSGASVASESIFKAFGSDTSYVDYIGIVYTYQGHGYAFFGSSAPMNTHNPEGEYTLDTSQVMASANCYLRKVDASMNVVWTRSLRAPGDSASFMQFPYCYCTPRQITMDASSRLVLYFRLAGCAGGYNSVRDAVTRYDLSTDTFTATQRHVITSYHYGNGQAWSTTLGHGNFKPTINYYGTGLGIISDSGDTIYSATYTAAVVVSQTNNLVARVSATTGAREWLSQYQTSQITVLNRSRPMSGVLNPSETRLYAHAYPANFYIIDVSTPGGTPGTIQEYMGVGLQAFPIGDTNTATTPEGGGWGAPMKLLPDHNGPGQHSIYIVSQDPQATKTFMGMSCGKADPSQTLDNYDFTFVRAIANDTDVVPIWCQSAGTSGRDLLPKIPNGLVVHVNHGIFQVGATQGSVPGYTRPGGHSSLDYLIVWLNHDGSLNQYFQGGTAGNEMLWSMHFDPSSGLPPMVFGTTSADIDGPGPEQFQGNTDFIYGFFNWTDGCGPGNYKSGVPVCTVCPSGYFQSNSDQLECLACPAGSETHVPYGSTNCTRCELGTVATSPLTQICSVCQLGQYMDEVGSSSICKVCTPGTYGDSIGMAECKRCAQGTYQPKSGQTSCLDCPNGATTEGDATAEERYCGCAIGEYGNPVGYYDSAVTSCIACDAVTTECNSRNMQYALPKAGHFISTSSPDIVMTCSPKAACPGRRLDYCLEGYTGSACTQCTNGFYRDAGNCVECPAFDFAAIGILVAVVLGFSVLCFLLIALAISTMCCKRVWRRWLLVARRARKIIARLQRTVAKYGIKFIQLMNVILVLDVAWPGGVEFLRDCFTFIGQYLSITAVIKIECMSSAQSVQQLKTAFQFTIFAVLLVLVAIVFLSACIGSILCPHFTRKFRGGLATSVVLQAVNVLYLTLHTIIVQPFACYDDGTGVYRMSADPTIIAFSTDPTWVTLATASLIGFGVVSVGVPVAFAVLVWGAHARSSKPTPLINFLLESSSFLSDPYTQRYYWYDILSISEKFFVGLTPLLVAAGSAAQSFYLMLIIMSYFCIYYRIGWEPFKVRSEFVWVVSVSGVAILTVVMSGIASRPAGDGTQNDKISNLLMTGVVAGGVAWIALLCLHAVVAVVWSEFVLCKKALCGHRPNHMSQLDAAGASTDADGIVEVKGDMNAREEVKKEVNPFEEVKAEAKIDDTERSEVTDQSSAKIAKSSAPVNGVKTSFRHPSTPGRPGATRAGGAAPKLVAPPPSSGTTPRKQSVNTHKPPQLARPSGR